jgi:hypothetical protein
MPKKTNNAVTCTKCHKYQPRKEYLDSGGRICNTCFAPQKKIIALKPGDPVIYVSPTSTNERKEPLREEMVVKEKAYKAGTRWMIKVLPKGSNSEGTLVSVVNLETL